MIPRPSRLAGWQNTVALGGEGRARRWCDLPPAELQGPTAAVVADALEGPAWAAAHVRTGEELLLASASRADVAVRQELAQEGFSVVGPDAPRVRASREGDPGRLWLLTSGSTGRPKRVAHTLSSLTTVTAAPAPQRWLCPYSPGSYAWWQLVTLALAHEDHELVVVDPSDLDTWPAAALARGVTAVSGTPTFWRRALLHGGDDLARLPLRQVTLGGEPVDQAVLDQLAATFPQARVTWIYASSELGASIVVHDGRAGFPVDWLDRAAPGRVLLRVVDDQLHVASPHGAHGLSGLVATGDRVRVADGRVHVVGRVSGDEINVGGTKVSAGEVRHVLQDHPDVRWARVFPRRAPLVGAVVAAEVVLAPGSQARSGAGDQDVTERLGTWCRDRLPVAAVPRRVTVLPGIPTTESLKSRVG